MGLHVLFLVENQPYPYDPRVRAEAQALVGAGYDVTVAAPTGGPFVNPRERVDGVDVWRFPAPPAGLGAAGYAREFGVSFARLASLTWRVHRQRAVDVAFICNPPDVLAALGVLLRRRGAGVVFDDRELSPELFEAKFGRRGPLHRLLAESERWAFRHADAILVTNPSYIENASRRAGIPDDRVFVVGNGPDPGRIFPVAERPELRRGRSNLVVWIGAMSTQEGLERLIEAADILVHERGRSDIAFSLIGPGDAHEHLRAEVQRRTLSDAVDVSGPVDDEMVRAYLSTADVCVAVDERNAMNDRAAMRKVLEYMAMGRAVVQFPLTEMQRLCGDATVYAAERDPRDLAAKIEHLLDHPDERARLGQAARRRVVEQRLLWPDQVPALLAAVERAAA